LDTGLSFFRESWFFDGDGIQTGWQLGDNVGAVVLRCGSPLRARILIRDLNLNTADGGPRGIRDGPCDGPVCGLSIQCGDKATQENRQATEPSN
jgi:hypothetical protein